MGREREWDRGLDFDKTKVAIGERLATTRLEMLPDADGFIDPFAVVRLSHYSTMALQLNNGSRANEAVSALRLWGTTSQRKLQVRVSKQSPRCQTCHHVRNQGRSPSSGHEVTGHGLRGKCLKPDCASHCTLYLPDPKDVEMRLIAVPPELLESDGLGIKAVVEKGYTLNSYKVFCRNHIAGNSHSLRYSYITMLHVKEKLSIAEIAKITHHRNVNELITYFQEGVAEATQLRIAGLRPKAEEGTPG